MDTTTILVLLIAFLLLIYVVSIIFLMLSNEKRIKKYVERHLVLDAHYHAENKVLLFLLLEAKGVNVGINTTSVLVNDHFSGIKEMEKINEQEAQMRRDAMNGESEKK